MLAKSRIFSVLILGLGAALVTWGLVSPQFFHEDGRLPLSLDDTTLTVRDGEARTTLNPGPGEVVTAPVIRQHHVELLDPADAETVTVRIGSTMMREAREDDLERLVEASVWSFVMDRVTGEARGPATMTSQLGIPPNEVPMSGLWAKFPADPEKTTYEVFDGTLRGSAPAVYTETVERGGRELNVYRQTIEPTNLATRYADMFNTTTLDTDDGGTEAGYLFYSAERDWYVDTGTGLVVDIHEKVEEYYGTRNGEPRQQVLAFDGAGTGESVDRLIEQAGHVPDGSGQRTLVTVLLVLGVVLMLAGLVGAVSGGRLRRRERRQEAHAGR
ncbi:DUF3068 domain-containing protein [Corynebacterium sp. P7202]|uniref:DUF3068 domain-containing protein n=1 Tax=Corynebacterium pygosceleis TaxID=2800406 RepID=A0A9Q4C755_9CORY|nr:DUF3068 domain-containing protein [Corynebacterium pygosceleis]MCK7637477.1 DUF3068 domain-containing protein [Corynebacterium pygosceleis]MCX7444994.1 DUF3068 domain-containing protein [Corynebacterium pygosceleis]MCX7468194.1 DUF3068 domain-containing protein [Corynebacterium pygosceleis]